MAFTEFDTGLLPREQRFDWWREVVGQGVAPTRITSDFASDFVGSVSSLDLGRLQLTKISFPALRSERTADLIRRADPETYELTLILGGLMGISQRRRTSRLAAGDIAMWSSSRPVQRSGDERAGEGRADGGRADRLMGEAPALDERSRARLGEPVRRSGSC
ncbi:hypothetical protein P3L51_34500 [Streptomyces sp. PSRA5]|uniref:AraC-like ligand-binding domain-containing protein n=1 Tax=Streptomyces panacea TaxID=3035064 RepID=UPI00339CDAB0